MPHYDFTLDLPIAEATELEVAKYLEDNFQMKLIHKCSDKDYDLLMNYNGKNITIEVKEDFTCERTGNINVEYECRGKNSGIRTTKADYYLYKVHCPDRKKRIFMIKVKDLRKSIKHSEYSRPIVGGDPGSNSKCYLYDLDRVNEIFMRLGTL